MFGCLRKGKMKNSENHRPEYNLVSSLVARIKGYDRIRVRELFDCARLRFTKFELDARRLDLCEYIIEDDDESIEDDDEPITLERCRKPSKVLAYGETAHLCEEHYDVELDDYDDDGFFAEMKQYAEKLADDPTINGEVRFGMSAKVSLTYSVPDIANLLITYIIFHIIGDRELYMTRLPLVEIVLKDYPELRAYSDPQQVVYVPCVATKQRPHDARWSSGWPLPFNRYQELLLSEGLITNDDLSWIERAALDARSGFTSYISDKILNSVELMCHESVFSALYKPLPPKERAELLFYSEVHSHLWGSYQGPPFRKYLFSALKRYQKELLPIWKDAKSQASKDQKNSLRVGRWREAIKGIYELELPDDLIEWLNTSTEQRNRYLLNRTDLIYLQKRLKAGFFISKPSEIALEHAARLCGSSPYSLSTARLWSIWRNPPKEDPFSFL